MLVRWDIPAAARGSRSAGTRPGILTGVLKATMSDPQVTTPAPRYDPGSHSKKSRRRGQPAPTVPIPHGGTNPGPDAAEAQPAPTRTGLGFSRSATIPDEIATMVIAVPFRVEGWHAPAGRRTREPPVSAKTGQIRPAAPAGARNWDPAGKPVTGQPQRRRPDRRSGRVPGSDATPRPPRNRVSKTRVEASLILPADMGGELVAVVATRATPERLSVRSWARPTAAGLASGRGGGDGGCGGGGEDRGHRLLDRLADDL